MTMKAEINIEEIKNGAVHSELLKALCLINQARNIVSNTMDENELRDAGQWDCMDETVTKLNKFTCDIGYIIGITVTGRVDSMMK